MKTRIILLAGRAQAGKTTACEYFKYWLGDKRPDLDVRIYSFADPLKRICAEIFNLDIRNLYGSNEDKNKSSTVRWGDLPFIDGESYDLFVSSRKVKYINDWEKENGLMWEEESLSNRELLQIFGSEICREMYPDCWAVATLKQIHQDNPAIALIADVRFPNEIDVFRAGGSLPEWAKDRIRPEPMIVRLTSNKLNSTHQSETALDNYDFKSLKNFYEINNDNMTIDQKNEALIGHLGFLAI